MEYAAVIAKVILTPVEMHQKSFVVIKDNGKKKTRLLYVSIIYKFRK